MSDGTLHAPEMQVWNNSAFNDNGEFNVPNIIIKSNMSSSCSCRAQSLDSTSSKENQSPGFEKPTLNVVPSSTRKKPLHSNNSITNSQQRRLKGPRLPKNVKEEAEKDIDRDCPRDESKIDIEIDYIEREISRLNSRLEKLRLEKLEIKLKNVEKKRGGGRVVPAKSVEEKKPMKGVGVDVAFDRRGVSLGPSEIWSSAAKSRVLTTPVSGRQNRRKSCFWKPEGVDELKVIKERGGKSISVSPRSRKPISKIPKQAATTAGIKKTGKKESSVLATIKPRTLFKDGEKSVPNKKVKAGRVVASRYSKIGAKNNNNNVNNSLSSNGTYGEARKRSLPDSDKEDVNKRRDSRGDGNGRVSKKWQINATEVVVAEVEAKEEEESPSYVSGMADMLPRIRTIRCIGETSRDSGPAKRVADLVGRKTCFSVDENCDGAGEIGDSVCQALSFCEEDDVVESSSLRPK